MAHATYPPVHDHPDGDSCRALIAEFIAQADVSQHTKVKYRAHLNEFHAWLNHAELHPDTPAPTRLVDVTAMQAHRFMAYLRQLDRPTSPTSGVALAGGTRKNYLASLRSLYGFLLDVGLVDIDPTSRIRRPASAVTQGLHLSPEELRRLLDVRSSPRSRIQTYLLAYTAARSGELRRLRWHDIDFVQRSIRLHGKRDKTRVVAIHPRLMSELRRWFLHQEAESERHEAVRIARANPDTDYVLLTRSGKPLSATSIYKQLNRRAVAAGLHVLEPAHGECRSRVSPHALRRTFATLLLNDGQPLDAVADILGHASVDTTRRHYAFASSARQRATVEAFNV